MTPEQLAASGTESGHQRAVFARAAQKDFRERFPLLERLMFAIPNGGSRGDNARSRAIRGAQLKAEGVKSGVADIFISLARHGYHGLYIEMKKPTNEKGRKGSLSDDQEKFRDAANMEGYGYVACYTWQEAIDNIERYCT